ncbi:hypothetical protein, partial [Snodgrassella alvi]|uniref:hypothetical protein n=1 Tax=Snodgrassella alvi TaxID=1196083 RepID=UPI0015C7398E
GRRLTNDEIGLIKNRYSVMMQKQGSKAKAAKSNTGKGTTSAQGLIGKDFENYLHQTLGGKGSFKNQGREFDGAYGPNNSIWYEAKSGRYWQDHAQAGSKGFEKFKSDVGSHASIAKQNGASFEVHSNTPIPQHVKDWLTSKNIPFKEY